MLSVKVKSVVPLKDMQLLVFFEDGKVKKFDVKPLIKDYPDFKALKDEDLFNLVKVEPGGYGVFWSPELDCSEGELYENSVDVPLTLTDFNCFVKNNIINTAEAGQIIGCTRQNIDDLIRRGKITPIKTYSKIRLFLKSDIEQRTW